MAEDSPYCVHAADQISEVNNRYAAGEDNIGHKVMVFGLDVKQPFEGIKPKAVCRQIFLTHGSTQQRSGIIIGSVLRAAL